MSDRFAELPFLKSVGLMMTYRCQVVCPHCIVQAGPDRCEAMSTEDACRWTREIAQYEGGRIRYLALTGGEPFTNVETLRIVTEYASLHGLAPSVVTNAFWASTPERAIEVLESIPAIKILSISTDRYHQLAIPLQRVRNAVTAAETCGVTYSISVCTENEADENYMDLRRDIEAFAPREVILTAIALPVGRALQRLGNRKYDMTADIPVSACATGATPIIFPDGRVIGCIGPVIDLPCTHPIFLGNLQQSTLQDILDEAQTNTILHALRAWGPKKLIELISASDVATEIPGQFIRESACDACYKLMANERIVTFLQHLGRDTAFRRKVAYARAYYLNEPEMVQMLGLSQNETRVECT